MAARRAKRADTSGLCRRTPIRGQRLDCIGRIPPRTLDATSFGSTIPASTALFQYLMTDPDVLGIVGWTGTVIGGVSLIVTVAGFWIAIAQIKRVKRSAEAAEAAVSRMTKVVKDREQNARLTHALSQLRIAKAYLQSNPGASGAYLDTGCTSLFGSAGVDHVGRRPG